MSGSDSRRARGKQRGTSRQKRSGSQSIRDHDRTHERRTRWSSLDLRSEFGDVAKPIRRSLATAQATTASLN